MVTRKAIFITGGGSGIGRATAQFFAGRGWFVGLADINKAGLAETAALLPEGQSASKVMDVRDRRQWETTLAEFWDASGGRLDILFNNAGIARGGLFEATSPEDNDLLVDINFKGVLHGAEAGLDYLKQTPGSCSCPPARRRPLWFAGACHLFRDQVCGARTDRRAQSRMGRTWYQGAFDHAELYRYAFAGHHGCRIQLDGTRRREGSGLEFTPVETVAQAVWDAAHGSKVHIVVGKTAKNIAFAARWAPWLIIRRSLRLKNSV